MSKIYEWLGTNGTLIDNVSKEKGVLTAGTSRGFVQTEKGLAMEFDSANTKLDTNLTPDLTGDITIETWMKPFTFGEGDFGRIINNGKLDLAVINQGGGFDNRLTMSSNGSTSSKSTASSINLSIWTFISITREADGTITYYVGNDTTPPADVTSSSNSGTPEAGTTDLIIGNNDAQGGTFDGNIARVIIYSGIGTTVERTNCYNEFLRASNLYETKRNFDYTGTGVPEAEQVTLRDSFNYQGIGNSPEEWCGDCTCSIQELTAQDSVLRHLDTGTKIVQYDVAGNNATQSEQAYGTWEFDVRSAGAGGSAMNINIISPSKLSNVAGGYNIGLSSTGTISFVRNLAAVNFSTAASYIAINTWYRLKVTRSPAGIFTVYIKGGAFGDAYVIVDVSGGSGTNPITDNTHTKSKYLVNDSDAGDRFTNLLIKKGVEV